MSILWIIIIGFVVGLIARLLMPGRDPAGFVITTLLGILGSFLGSFMGRAVGLYREGETAGLIMSVIGAMIVLWIYHAFSRRRGTVGT